MCVPALADTHTHTHIYTHTLSLACALTHTHTPTHTHARARKYALTCARAHTHTHTHRHSPWSSPKLECTHHYLNSLTKGSVVNAGWGIKKRKTHQELEEWRGRQERLLHQFMEVCGDKDMGTLWSLVQPVAQGGTQQGHPIHLLGSECRIFFFFFFFFGVPQLYLWGSPLLGEIFAYVTVF